MFIKQVLKSQVWFPLLWNFPPLGRDTQAKEQSQATWQVLHRGGRRVSGPLVGELIQLSERVWLFLLLSTLHSLKGPQRLSHLSGSRFPWILWKLWILSWVATVTHVPTYMCAHTWARTLIYTPSCTWTYTGNNTGCMISGSLVENLLRISRQQSIKSSK